MSKINPNQRLEDALNAALAYDMLNSYERGFLDSQLNRVDISPESFWENRITVEEVAHELSQLTYTHKQVKLLNVIVDKLLDHPQMRKFCAKA